MIRVLGTTNGFYYSESLIGCSRPPAIDVVQTVGGRFYATSSAGYGRRWAKRHGAPGFWRVKK